MNTSNIDLGVVQETKVTNGFHTRILAGCHVFATDVPIRHIGGVEVSYRYDATHLQVKAMHQNGPNVLSFRVASGGRWWFIVGCYITPDGTATIWQRPRGAALLVEEEFIMYLATP